jgi:hypothetical protein
LFFREIVESLTAEYKAAESKNYLEWGLEDMKNDDSMI